MTQRRRYVNAGVIMVATMLAARAMLYSTGDTRGFLEAIGVAAAIATATLISMWHLASSGRDVRLAYALCILLIMGAAGTAATAHAMKEGAGGVTPWIAYCTFIVTVGTLPLAAIISVLGLGPAGRKR